MEAVVMGERGEVGTESVESRRPIVGQYLNLSEAPSSEIIVKSSELRLSTPLVV
jgi:hypothetical protein